MELKHIYIILILMSLSYFSFGQDTLILDNCCKNELKDICKRTNLKYLEIIRYESNELPENIGELANLEYLEINYGKIATIPKSIGNLKKLEKLTISNGYTKIVIPPEIGNLTELKELNIFNYHFDSLPTEIGNLENLEKVMICGDLNELPISISSWKKIQSLYLRGNNLSQIPQYFYAFSQLEYLDLSNNKITFISDSISLLKNLEDLTLSGNIELTKLPESICNLEKLSEIEILSTKIIDLPKCLSKSENLEMIVMCKTLIENPEELNSDLNGKIKWYWNCRDMKMQLVNFQKIYGNYKLNYKTKKDTLYLNIKYSYNEPNVIDEEYTREIDLKIANRDKLKTNKIYSTANSNFIITTSMFSIWNWSEQEKNNITGYILFKEIKEGKIVVYLKLDLIDNERKIHLIDDILEF